ncbi:MAG: ADP-ribosylglycohydrolase family protein [Planctomycetota bacterium]
MLGAICGDVIGSYYEHFPVKRTDFDLFPDDADFTDDTVLTCAVAEWLMDDAEALAPYLHRYYAAYPDAGYGGFFRHWAFCEKTEPYNSWGNGGAMRVSPVGWVARDEQHALDLAKRSADATHNHPDGVRGAQAVAVGIFLARQGAAIDDIRKAIESKFDYDCTTPLEDIRPEYGFDVSASGSVPQSIRAFIESHDYESAVRNAISLGGDSDTMACIAGSIAEAAYGGVPKSIERKTMELLDDRIVSVIERFYGRYGA